MKCIFFLSCFIMLMFISCVRSLYPVTENVKDISFNKQLVGIWKDARGESEYIIDSVSTMHGEGYKVMLLDHNSDNNTTDTSNLRVSLVNIKGRYFLDCIADTSQPSYAHTGDWNKSFSLPCHIIIKVYSIGKDFIVMSAIDKDALSNLLKNKKIIMKHEDIDKDNILLTEKSAVLQHKLLELEKFPGVYEKDSLIRVQ